MGGGTPPRHDHQPTAGAHHDQPTTLHGLPLMPTAIDHTNRKEDREQHTPPSLVSTMTYHSCNSTLASQAVDVVRPPHPPPWRPPCTCRTAHRTKGGPPCQPMSHHPGHWVTSATAKKWGLHPTEEDAANSCRTSPRGQDRHRSPQNAPPMRESSNLTSI
jgi:hypothetical protein